MAGIHYKKLQDWDSGLVRLIVRRHPKGFLGANIQGERGYGKSMYAYKVMAKTYMIINGYTQEADAYEDALKHMLFDPKDFITLIKNNIEKDYITPILTLDDATVHFNSYKFFTDIYQVILLKGLFDTIRTAVTGLLMTCPTRRLLLKFLRDYDDLKIQIFKLKSQPDAYDRLARCYQFIWYPDDKKYRVHIRFQDKYSCYVPNEYYEPYMEKRKKYLQQVNEKLERLIQEK
ncbi:MAG: hypothetical protein DRN08_03075, partial [Thermoplasmata archaeon]